MTPPDDSGWLDAAAVQQALQTLDPHWTGGPDELRRTIAFADFPTAVRFVDEIVAVCEERDHHPDLGLSWREVTVRLTTHSAGGVTAKDVDLAGDLDRIAAGLPQA